MSADTDAGTDADTDAGAGTGADGHSVYPWSLRFIEKRGYCAFANRSFMPGQLLVKVSELLLLLLSWSIIIL